MFFILYLFRQKSGKVAIARLLIINSLRVYAKETRKFATPSEILVANAKIKSQMRLYWSQFRALVIWEQREYYS